MNTLSRILPSAFLLLLPFALASIHAQTSPPPRQTLAGHTQIACDGIVQTCDSIVPDTHGAVSEDYLVAVANFSVPIIRRDGTQVDRNTDLGTWWDRLRPPGEPVFSPFDPVITYDPAGQRWITAASSNGQDTMNSRLLIAVSASSNPTGAWYLYIFRVTDAGFGFNNTVWWDQPTIGFSRDFIAVDVTTIVGISDSLIVLNKAAAYSGRTVAWRVSAAIPGALLRGAESGSDRRKAVCRATRGFAQRTLFPDAWRGQCVRRFYPLALRSASGAGLLPQVCGAAG